MLVAQLQRAIEGLNSAADVPDLLRRLCVVACEQLGAQRATLSRVDGTQATVVALHARGGDDLDLLRRRHVGRARALEPGSIEAEALRRRRYALAPDGRAIVPVTVDDRVVGELIAEGEGWTDEHAAAAAALVAAFGHAAARAALAARLAAQGRHVAEMAVNTRAVVSELGSLPLDPFSPDPDTWALIAGTATLTAAPTLEARAQLSPRERSIVELMATGATNALIAERLCLSEETVKTHVRRILRKLGAANRAEAVSRYLRSPQPATLHGLGELR
jgi:DNA-binding CsgD family transcriptional regulator